MPATAYPGMLANIGAPYLNVSPLITYGEIYYVHAGRGSNNNDGRDSLRPRASLFGTNGAYQKCRATRGDMVICLEGHTETLSDATTGALDIAGVRVHGMGIGNERPTFTLSTVVGATITVSAARNLFDNCIIDATGIDAITAAINVQAADFRFTRNRVIVANATNQAVLGILTTTAADRMWLEANRFEGTVDAGTATAIRIVGTDEAVVKDNYIVGAYTGTLGGLENVTTDCTNILIAGNYIENRTAASTIAMTLRAASTGFFANNRLSVLGGAAAVVFAAGSNGGGNYQSFVAGVTAAALL